MRYALMSSTSLANRFRFLEKRGDFSYAHELTRAMQTYPALRHRGPYRFTGFDRAAVEAVLAQLVPERLHLWEIDQAQSVSEGLGAPRRPRVEPLVLPDAAALTAAAEEYELALPAQNHSCPRLLHWRKTTANPAGG